MKLSTLKLSTLKLSTRPLPLLLGTAGIASAAAIAMGGAQLATDASTTTSAAGPSITRVTDPHAGGYGLQPGHGGSPDTAPSTTDGTTPTPTPTLTAGTPTEATASQLVGVVDIVSTVDYDQGEAAGTGMVLTSSGEVLTNNHVVEGATSITVTVLSTGRTYAATVVGTSPTNDVAVLQLSGRADSRRWTPAGPRPCRSVTP